MSEGTMIVISYRKDMKPRVVTKMIKGKPRVIEYDGYTPGD